MGSRPLSIRGCVPVAKRWVVERTFAGLIGLRRLAIDYEFAPRSQKARLLIATHDQVSQSLRTRFIF
ncbi:hypothetical protein GCM10027422_43510 [Hymenobacter arcticus]